MSLMINTIPFYYYGNKIGIEPVADNDLLKDILELTEDDEISDDIKEFYKDRVAMFEKISSQMSKSLTSPEKFFTSQDVLKGNVTQAIEERSGQLQMFITGLERSGSVDISDNQIEEAIDRIDQHIEELGDMLISLESDADIISDDPEFLTDLENVWDETVFVWGECLDILLNRLHFWKEKMK